MPNSTAPRMARPKRYRCPLDDGPPLSGKAHQPVFQQRAESKPAEKGHPLDVVPGIPHQHGWQQKGKGQKDKQLFIPGFQVDPVERQGDAHP